MEVSVLELEIGQLVETQTSENKALNKDGWLLLTERAIWLAAGRLARQGISHYFLPLGIEASSSKENYKRCGCVGARCQSSPFHSERKTAVVSV